MRNQILVAACMAVLITMATSCKKEAAQKQGPVPATPQQLEALNSKLTGTWGYVWGQIAFYNTGGIPSNDSYPFKGSLRFDGSSTATTIALDGTTTTRAYTISGFDSTFYVNVKDAGADTLTRNCKVALLTADSLVLKNTLTGSDTATKLIYTQIYTKAPQAEVDGNIFRVTVSPFINGQFIYPFNVNTDVYITHTGGQPQLVESRQNLTQAYSYSYKPAEGDTVHIVLSGQPYAAPVVQCIAYYRGVPYGMDWLTTGASSPLQKTWVINN
jgi:hypothetical protein